VAHYLKDIDDTLTFYANTTRFDTGVATDSDSVPTYRVYEDETTTAILTGSMALLDSTNTAGFYSEQITLSAANGFEVGKDYAIYVQATVNSVVGAWANTIQVAAKVNLSRIAGATVSTSTAQLGVNVVNAGATVWGSGAITANSIASGAITNAKFAAGAIDATAIADNAIDAGAIAANAITSAKIATDAIGTAQLTAAVVTEIQAGLATAAALATAQTDLDTITGANGVIIASGTQTFNMTGNITGNVSGSVGSVTGAVGSVTGSVGGNVTGTVGSVVGAVGSVTGNVDGNVVGSVGSVATEVDANITKVNSITVTGDGQPGTEWGP